MRGCVKCPFSPSLTVARGRARLGLAPGWALFTEAAIRTMSTGPSTNFRGGLGLADQYRQE